MIRRPPRSTRTDTLVPYTTLFRSLIVQHRPLAEVATELGRYDPAYFVVASHSARSEEHTSELQSLMRISYAVFCLKKKKSKYLSTYYPHLLTLISCTYHIIILKHTN